jgi:hypothetical protein
MGKGRKGKTNENDEEDRNYNDEKRPSASFFIGDHDSKPAKVLKIYISLKCLNDNEQIYFLRLLVQMMKRLSWKKLLFHPMEDGDG